MPGLNRAARRQMERAQGHRGSKAKRQHGPQPRFLGPPPIEVQDAIKAQMKSQMEAEQDHTERNRLRALGFVVPPSSVEAEGLRSQGHQVGGGGLQVVGG
jgi:hypothetical protein